MRELESRIQALESDKAEQALEVVQLVAQVRRLEHAHTSVRRGWEIMTRGMRALDSSMDQSEEEIPNSWAPSGLQGLGLMPSQEQTAPAFQKSSHIFLDRSVLPAGVVRSIARPPGAHIIDVMEGEEESEEEDEGEEKQDQDQWQSQLERDEETVRVTTSDQEDTTQSSEVTPRLESEPRFSSENQSNAPTISSNSLQAVSGILSAQAHSGDSLLELAAAIASGGISHGQNSAEAVGLWGHSPFDPDGAPSPLSSPPIAFDGETFPNPDWTIYVTDPSSRKTASTSLLPPSSETTKARPKARRSSRRHSGLLSAPLQEPEDTSQSLSRASSMASLTDFESLPTDSPFDSEVEEALKSPPSEFQPLGTVSADDPEPSEDGVSLKRQKSLGKKEKGKRKTIAKKTSTGQLEGSASEGEFLELSRMNVVRELSPDLCSSPLLSYHSWRTETKAGR